MPETTDVVVVGGGLVGAACAYELARDGQRVVLSTVTMPVGATDAGAGILSPETMGGMPARSSTSPTSLATTTARWSLRSPRSACPTRGTQCVVPAHRVPRVRRRRVRGQLT